MAKVSVQKVADFFLDFCHEHGDFLSNLKLQKLVYYAQAWHLALYDKKLFEAHIEAWVHGPVVPSVYRRFKSFQWGPITYKPEKIDLDEHTSSFLEEVMNVYGRYSAHELELMTHSEEPWIKARAGLPMDEPSTNPISCKDMKKFYAARANE